MGYFEYRFRSMILGRYTSMAVYIPPVSPRRLRQGASVADCYPPDLKLPTLFLMHGGGADCTDWFHGTRIANYADRKGLMLVSTDLGSSFCTDMVDGLPYFTFYTQEFMPLVRSLFPSSTAREDTFVAGFSMGGHCAMKVALRCPEQFAAVFAMSGAKDMVKMAELAKQIGNTNGDNERKCFGDMDRFYGSENDLLYLAEKVAKSDGPKPMIYTSCGLEDYGIELCREYKVHLDKVGLKNEFFTPHGTHSMDYCEEMIKKAVLELFDIRDPWA